MFGIYYYTVACFFYSFFLSTFPVLFLYYNPSINEFTCINEICYNTILEYIDVFFLFFYIYLDYLSIQSSLCVL